MAKKTSFREVNRNTWRLGKILWKDMRALTVGSLLIFILGSFRPLLVSGSLALLVQSLLSPTQIHLWPLALLYVVVITVPPMLFLVQNYCTKMMWFFLGQKFDIDIVRKKGNLDLASLESPKNNDLFNKVQENGATRVKMFTERTFHLIQNVAEVALTTFVLVSLKWWLFPVILLGSLPQLLIEVKFGDQVWGIFSWHAEKRRRYYDLQKQFHYLPWLTEMKLFQNVNPFVERMAVLFSEFRIDQENSEKRKLKWQTIGSIVTAISFGICAAYFIHQVSVGLLTISLMIFGLACVMDLRQSISSFFYNLGRHYEDSLFITEYFQFDDIPRILTQNPKGHKIGDRTPTIEFEDVTFAYPGTEKLVLNGFSLMIPAGQKIALIGINGAGKTTVIKLLCRFYDPTGGRILIDGVDLRDIDLETWYDHLGALFQEYAHYKFPVKDAIGVGRSSRPLCLEDVTAAATDSESLEFINAWPLNFDQVLGKEFENGVEPSVGQWQKLAIARLFYRDANVLILDEPTSAIDAEAEAQIFNKIENLPEDKSVIFISHRFSTVRMAHRIALVSEGRVKEVGTHEELLASDADYTRLFELQAKGYSSSGVSA
jgi:ATP-binding cassette subfamily B protein